MLCRTVTTVKQRIIFQLQIHEEDIDEDENTHNETEEEHHHAEDVDGPIVVSLPSGIPALKPNMTLHDVQPQFLPWSYDVIWNITVTQRSIGGDKVNAK